MWTSRSSTPACAPARSFTKIVSAEIKKRSKKNGNALVVGAGELGQQTAQFIRNGDDYRVDCIVDTENESVGRMLDGLPVYSLDQLKDVLEKHKITCVFLAEPNLKKQDKWSVAKVCSDMNVELKERQIYFEGEQKAEIPTFSEVRFVPVASVDERWAEEYKKQFGEEQKIMDFCKEPKSTKEIAAMLGYKERKSAAR